MSFAPPRKPPGGSQLPLVRKTSSVIRETPSETTMTSVTTTSLPRSTASSGRPTSGASAPCCGGQSKLKPPSNLQGRIPTAGRLAVPGSTLRPPSGMPQRTPAAGRMTGPAPCSYLRPPEMPQRTPATGRMAGPAPGSLLRPPGSAVYGSTPAAYARTPAASARAPAAPTPRTGVCPGSAAGARAIPAPRRSIPAPQGRAPPPNVTVRQQPIPAATPRGRIQQQIEQSTSQIDRAIPRPSDLQRPSMSGSAASVPATRSTGAIPKVPKPQLVAQSSKTSATCGKKTTVTQQVEKVPCVPEGRYAMSLKYPPQSKAGRFATFGSPHYLRARMDEGAPKNLKLIPPEYKGIQDIRKLTAYAPYKDTVSCAMDIRHDGRPVTAPDLYDYSFLDTNVEPEYGSPYGPAPGSEQTDLERDVEATLLEEVALTPSKAVKVSGSRKSPGKLPVIMTDHGPIPATEQLITEKRVEKTPGSEKITRHLTGIEQQGCGAIQFELDTQTLEPDGGLPKRGDAALESVSVTSSIAIAPGGIKETTTTVVYETTKTPEKISMSPEEVERLVTEEAIDVDKAKGFKPLDLKVISPLTYPIRKREHELKLNYASVLELEEAVTLPEPNPDQEQEEVQPETVASIMHTEEQGHRLGTQPAQMYDILFPDTIGEATITVNSAAPAPLQDVIVPSHLPEGFHMQGITQELGMAATTTPHEAESKPDGNAYTENVQKTQKKRAYKNVAKRGDRRKLTDVPLLSREPPPWAMEDLQPIIDIVGASPASSNFVPRTETAHLVAEPIDERDQDEIEQTATAPEEEGPEPCGIEYSLRLEPPSHSSRVQLRGSTRPPWFPGYYVALPEISGLIRIDKSPGHVLSSAWQAVQPNYFPDDSIITV